MNCSFTRSTWHSHIWSFKTIFSKGDYTFFTWENTIIKSRGWARYTFLSNHNIHKSLCGLRPWSFKPVTDITGWYFFPVILFLLFPDKSIYSTSINWAIGNALMKPITDYKWQEQDYRKKMSACNVSYRLKWSGHIGLGAFCTTNWTPYYHPSPTWLSCNQQCHSMKMLQFSKQPEFNLTKW